MTKHDSHLSDSQSKRLSVPVWLQPFIQHAWRETWGLAMYSTSGGRAEYAYTATEETRASMRQGIEKLTIGARVFIDPLTSGWLARR